MIIPKVSDQFDSFYFNQSRLHDMSYDYYLIWQMTLDMLKLMAKNIYLLKLEEKTSKVQLGLTQKHQHKMCQNNNF